MKYSNIRDLTLKRHEEHEGYEYKTDAQSDERLHTIGHGLLLIEVNEYNGGETEEVEQVHTDRKPREVENQHQPAVATGFVGMVFPLENQPEYDSSQE